MLDKHRLCIYGASRSLGQLEAKLREFESEPAERGNFCNCGWPVLVVDDDTPMLRNITSPNSLKRADLFKNAVRKKGSKWGFVRLADLKRRSDISVPGDGLCRGVTPHVPLGINHPIKERWPLVCSEHDQAHPNADW